MESLTLGEIMTPRSTGKEVLKEFIEDCRLRGMTGGSISSYKSDLKIFSDYLISNEFNLFSVDRGVLKGFLGYLKGKGLALKTIEHYFTSIGAFYDYLSYEGLANNSPIPQFRKRYLRRYKDDPPGERKLISVEQMSALIDSILDPQGKAIAILLAKTGIRRNELINIDADDVNWGDLSVRLKPTAKRSNRLVFFDDECGRVLRRWVEVRKEIAEEGERGLFVSETGRRINRNSVYNAITKWAERAGLHDPSSPKLEDHFSPHCFRHWFTTHLIRNGMPREYVKELRGDARYEAIDLYHHIDREELRRSYLAHIPKLGI